MAHNAYIRAGAIWTGSATIATSEMSAFDVAQFKSLNADDGGTWAPTNPIILGGAGVQITGGLTISTAALSCNANANFTGLTTLASCNGVTFVGSCLIDVQNGCLLRIDSGASIEVSTGAALNLDGTVNPTYSTPRTVTKKGLVLLASTYGGAAGNAFTSTPATADVWGDGTYGPGIITRGLLVQAGQSFDVAVPGIDQMTGATLVSVALVTAGVNGIVPTTYPTYNVFRANGLISTVSLRAAGAVTDHHNTPTTWPLTADTTTFTCDQNNTNLDPGTFKYFVQCTLPSANTSTGAQMFMVEVIATYSVSTLQK